MLHDLSLDVMQGRMPPFFLKKKRNEKRSPVINTCLSSRYFPGHIHAFYLEYVYYQRRDRDPATRATQQPAPGVYSERIQNGGHSRAPNPNYGAV